MTFFFWLRLPNSSPTDFFLKKIGSIGLILFSLFMFIPHVDQTICCFNVRPGEATSREDSFPSKQIFKRGLALSPLSLGLLRTHMSCEKAVELSALEGTVLVFCNLSICSNIKLWTTTKALTERQYEISEIMWTSKKIGYTLGCFFVCRVTVQVGR